MHLRTYTDEELILMADNLPNPTPLEKELSDRLEEALRELAAATTPPPTNKRYDKHN